MSTINYLTVRNTVLPTVNAVTMNYSTLTGSTIRASILSLSTLTVSSINGALPGTGAFSTLALSSLNVVSTITASSITVTTGNVGIGTTPSYALHVQGAIYASGNITALSDQRYKQNIVRLDRSLDTISSLSGYSYTRTDYQPGIRQIGLLAQEVNKVLPEAVSYDTINDIYSLNYGCLIAPVIEAVKEINEKVNSRIGELEAKINAQQVLIQQLLDRVA